MKVKVIDECYASDLEKTINDFISDLESSSGTVVDIKYSTEISDMTGILTTALIMYEEAKK